MQTASNAVVAAFFALCVVVFCVVFAPGTSSLALFLIAAIFGIFLAFNIGANDVANAFGTSVGARTLSIKQALLIAAVFEFAGAFFAGGSVTATIKNGVVGLSEGAPPQYFAYVMLAALGAASAWIFIATAKSLPVSSTHSVVGGLIGAALGLGAISSLGAKVHWADVGQIALSWVVSPLLGGVLSYAIFAAISRLIVVPLKQKAIELKQIKKAAKNYKKAAIAQMLGADKQRLAVELSGILLGEKSEFSAKMAEFSEQERALGIDKFLAARLPVVAAMIAVVITSLLLFKALKIELDAVEAAVILVLVGLSAYILCAALINLMRKKDPKKALNRVFSWFQIFTACTFAFSHGANDISNAVGPFSAILDYLHGADLAQEHAVAPGVMMIFALALVVGLWFLGKSVIKTVGKELAKIKPPTGFSAEFASAIVILFATQLGIPISSTHILIGAVLGIGVYNRNAKWGQMRSIALAWVVTLPASAAMGAAICCGLFFAFG